jgi:hypothetical protein
MIILMGKEQIYTHSKSPEIYSGLTREIIAFIAWRRSAASAI